MNNQSYHTDRMSEYPDTLLTAAELGEADVPVTPLPNPGEGGPVYSGSRPGFPPIFRPIFPGNSGSVTVIPGITFPCYNCTATSFGRVRILNASTGYQPFYVYLGNWMVASSLGNGDITGYVQSASGTQTVTVSGANGYVYIQKTVQVRSSASMTIAIINTASGLDIMEISDISCNAPSGSSCLRVCNLAYASGAVNVTLPNAFMSFTNTQPGNAGSFSRLQSGTYSVNVARSARPAVNLLSTFINLNPNRIYTLYVMNWNPSPDTIRILLVEDMR